MLNTMNLRKSYFPSKYIQGNGAIKELTPLIDLYGGSAFLLVTPSMGELARKNCWDQLYTMEVFRGPCCWMEINRLIEIVSKGKYTVIVGFGGGKVVDTAKVIADKLDLRVIMVPTVAASSAAYSACSVIYSVEDIAESVYYEKHSPDVLLVDNNIIIGAKTRYFVAGMADSLATFFEGKACLKSDAPNSLSARQTFSAVAMSEYCYEAILKYGESARCAYEKQVITPAVERMIEINLLSAGMAFEGTGLAAAHAIHNGLTILPQIHSCLHGEIVAFGILAELHLADVDPAEMDRIYKFFYNMDLPITFADLGLLDISRETLMQVAAATHNDPYLCHERASITIEEILAALVAADGLGHLYKK